MFRNLIRPDYIFLIGVLQALLPYPLWAFGRGVVSSGFDVGYTPIAIWIVGYISFWVGCRLVSAKTPSHAGFDLRPYSRSVVTASLVTILALVLQTAWAIQAYGTLPILSYIAGDGTIDVSSANAMQEDSAFGQFGLMILTTYMANCVLLLLIIVCAQDKKRRTLLVAGLMVTLAVASLINGKRQELLTAAVYVTIGLLVQTGSLRGVCGLLPLLPRSRMLRSGLLVISVGIGIFLMGKLAELRTGGHVEFSGVDEIIRYLEYPILNLSAQCEQSGGFGPYAFSVRYPLQRLLPFKLVDAWLSEDIPPPVRVEKSSPSGMFEYIQWGWGPLGIVGFCIALGACCTFVYRKAHADIRYFLIYPTFGYALLTGHSYSHFLTLVYVPVPSLLFFFLAKPMLRYNKNRRLGQHASSSIRPFNNPVAAPQTS